MQISSRPTSAAIVRLRVVEAGTAGLEGRELVLGAGEVVIGRADDCGFPIADPAMSRRHARVEATADGLRVTDNGSANGVQVDGQRVPEATLGDGGRFVLGQTTFEVAVELPPPPAPAAAPAPAPPSAGQEIPLVERTLSIADIAEIVRQIERPKSFEDEGEHFVALANKPMVLSDPDAVYLVESGKVEIFTVALENNQPVGARTHFLTVEAGQLFFGMDTDRYGMGSGFLAVGKAGSDLRRYSAARLLRMGETPAHGARLAPLLTRWVEAMSRRLVQEIEVARADVSLESGKPFEAAPGKRVASERGVAWVEMPAGQFLFDGMASASWEVEGVLIPLAPGSWIELLGGAESLKATPRATPEVVGDPRAWAGLEVFHRLLCECEFLNKRLSTVDEFNRLQNKAVQIEQAREQAMGAIGSVLGGTGVWERPSFQGADLEPIVRAMQFVGSKLGVPIRSHPEGKEKRSFDETVSSVCLASRLRNRRVALVDDWWNYDQGPMLGQFEETKTPVALLPTGPTSYEAVDPANGKRVPVNGQFVRALAPFAYTFYTGFGDQAVSAKQLIRFALRGLAPDFRTTALMGIGLGLLGTLTPMITGKVFDTAIPQAERAMLFQFAGGLFLVALTQAAFKVSQSIAMIRVQGKMDYRAQSAVWDRLLDLPMTFFRKYSAGDLADRASGVDQIRSIVAGAGIAAVLGSFSSIFNVFQMAGYDVKLAAVGIGLTLVYVGVTTAANYAQLKFQRDEQKRRGRIMGLVLQLITGVAKLRVCGAENHAFRVWATAFSEQRKVSFKLGGIRNIMAVFNADFPVLSSMVIFITMVSLKKAAAESGTEFEMTTGDFLAFSAAYGMFIGAMQSLGDASLSMLKIVPIFERLRPILEEAPEVDSTKVYPGRLNGAIDISHVSFRYTSDGPWILKDVSLKIQPGEFVALVGGSGSGKSTLMRLMLGFEMPEMGSIYYDGQDLATLDLRMVRSQLGVVLQESRLLPADIYRNIVGSSSRTVQEAWEAAEKAGLADDIKAMPMQMHTVVAEGGGAFSGGQKQRLMIARAIVHRPKIIFLDEATSALDNKTQAIVTESMNKLAATRIVIAHRLSTVVNADRICYLEHGQLKEQGTFKELMELDGLFAALAKRQLA
jgi:ATP-binding cassette subfamily C protein